LHDLVKGPSPASRPLPLAFFRKSISCPTTDAWFKGILSCEATHPHPYS
jgi:hypothetical protein